MSPTRSVVITGLGVVSPLGHDVASFWAALLEGRSGVRALDQPWLDPAEFKTRIGAPVVGFDLRERGFQDRDLRGLDPTCQLAIGAALEALQSAGLNLVRRPGKSTTFSVEGLRPDRTTTVISSGVGGLTSFEAVHRTWVQEGSFRGRGFLRFGLPRLIPNAAAANVAIAFGLTGECSCTPTACAAGTMALGDAFRRIASGEADAALAGGAEGVVNDLDGLGLMGFDVLNVMSTRNDEPLRAARPFDADRDGFVLGEGAGVLVLEERGHAEARGAPILAELISYASTCDAHSMLQPHPEGLAVERAFRLALDRAGLPPSEVQHVNAHGTGTLAGDPVEAAAIRRVFGEGSGAPLVSATKSLTGHCIGASGAFEAIATVLSLREGRLHATLNLDRVGEGCELNHVRGEARHEPIEHAVSASFGFGGHDAVLLFGRA